MSILLDEILELPVAERIKLVEEIWDSINGSPEAVHITPEQKAELGRRLEDHRANPGGNFSWDEIKAEALSR
ncbi:MAG: addiction module protein [Saprospiraceae bacterium]|nr:addiction module protein [Pyrinomonadaceae bacterium]